jgi:hypothetical protein
VAEIDRDRRRRPRLVALLAALCAGTAAVAAAGAATQPDVLRGWNEQTVACNALTIPEVAQAIDVPSSQIFRPRGGVFGSGLTTLEQDHSAYCQWQSEDSNVYAFLILDPETTPPTLAYARRLYEQTGALTKTPGPCTPAGGIGAGACVFRGATPPIVPNGTLLAVKGHVVVQLIIAATPTEPLAAQHAHEEALARAILGRVKLANR